MYCKPSALLVPNAPLDAPTIQSSSGVRQGDPCGPLFFALTVQPMLQSVQQCFAEVRVIAYLDDVVLQGPYEEVKSAYRELRSQLDAAGLHIQRAKASCILLILHLLLTLHFSLGFNMQLMDWWWLAALLGPLNLLQLRLSPQQRESSN
jgi:hypothetical protein